MNTYLSEQPELLGRVSLKFSVVIPARNEEACIDGTLLATSKALDAAKIDYEILVIADHCTDNTEAIVRNCSQSNARIRVLRNNERNGFGASVRLGLDHYKGDAVAIYMADASDSPDDLVRYYKEIERGSECVFGSRFIKGAKVVSYPIHKRILNRLLNLLICAMFGYRYNDTTNAFKCYRREVISGCQPLLSRHFNLTVEIPLKAIIRGYTYTVIPIQWTNRKTGVSKLKITEMGSRYFFIILYCFLERLLTGIDYRRSND